MAVKYTFSGHESFPCKMLWLKKGFDFVAHGGNFNAPNAIVDLGVGKNMVSSIRYWLKVFDIYSANGLTWLADYLFDDVNGRDCYIEDIATLWLLHFNLVFSEEASLYNMLFCGLQRERILFSREQALSYVKLKTAEAGKSSAFNANTVKKDIGVFIQNYALPRKPQSNEDFSSLLIDLDLVRQDVETGSYYFNTEGKRQIPQEVFLYGLLRLKEKVNDGTIAFDVIQEQVGLVFCMNNQETMNMLKKLSKIYSDFFSCSDVAGICQVQFVSHLDYRRVLNDYYERNV